MTIGSDALQTYSSAYKKDAASASFADAISGKSSFSATGTGKYYSLQSTGAVGKSIFWKLGKK